MVAVISVDLYPFFFTFSGLSCDLEDTGMCVFWWHTVLPDSKETEFGSSNQEASPSAGKITRVVFSTMMHMEVCPYSYFQWCKYFSGPWVSFVTTNEFSVRVTKIISRIGVSRTHSLPFLTYF